MISSLFLFEGKKVEQQLGKELRGIVGITLAFSKANKLASTLQDEYAINSIDKLRALENDDLIYILADVGFEERHIKKLNAHFGKVPTFANFFTQSKRLYLSELLSDFYGWHII